MIAISGASGFIGSQLMSQISDAIPIYRGNEASSLNAIFVNKIDGNTDWSGKLKNINAIIHLAGVAHSKKLSFTEFEDVNFHGTLNLARSSYHAGVKRFVYVSTIGVLGANSLSAPFATESKTSPHDDYSFVKLKTETELIKFSKETGLELVIIRPPLVYGAGAPGNFGALTQLIAKVPLLPFGLVKNKRDFISVLNLAHLLSLCATHPKAAGNIFLASDSETVSIKEFTNAMAKGLGKKVYQLPIPLWLMRIAGKLLGKSAMIEQLVGNLQVDSSDLRKVLGWTPPYTMGESMALLKEQDKERN
ncbi:UDP-glucose 4-epimerase [Vibrio chagasii]|nr:UDP-glucose 4-epimerase [Vibrio chagasii]